MRSPRQESESSSRRTDMAQPSLPAPSSGVLVDVERYLRDCFASEEVPRATELAERCGMSPPELTRTFARELGVRPAAYLKSQQVELAKVLLVTTTLTTTQIAYRAGFGTRATFFRVFRRATEMTPAEFRKRLCRDREPA